MSIFVHISSYCDPELVPTINDCLEKASKPQELTFGICWQHKLEDCSMNQFSGNLAFRIDDVLDTQTQGCCWARARSQALYNGEDYVLQLDGHHRFEQGWDETLMRMMAQTEAKKPIITAYGGSYDAETGKHDCVPWKMKPKEMFGPDGALLCVPVKIPNWDGLKAPIPARFLSGHFMFTLGRWCREVPYDPLLQFHGEEPTLSARSFTCGYDLFHPHKLVIWHQYHRKNRNRHWDDFPKLHQDRDKISKGRVRQLMGMEAGGHDLSGYGFGSERSFEEYEAFSGLDFKGRRIHQDCFDGIDPPCATDQRWAKEYKVLVTWTGDQISIPEDCTHVAYFVDNAEEKMIWHKDVGKEEGFQCEIVAKFLSTSAPSKLVVWPHTKNGPWKKFVIPIREQSVYF